jgi:ATP synthase protein I
MVLIFRESREGILALAPRGKETVKLIKQVAAYSTLGLEMGLSVAVGAAIGYYLDRWLKTEPWLLICFILFGVVAGYRSLYRALKRLQKEDAED